MISAENFFFCRENSGVKRGVTGGRAQTYPSYPGMAAAQAKINYTWPRQTLALAQGCLLASTDHAWACYSQQSAQALPGGFSMCSDESRKQTTPHFFTHRRDPFPETRRNPPL